MSQKQNIDSDLCGTSNDETIKERNYMNLSFSTSTDSSTISNISEEILSLKANDMGSNFKETELTLGLSGSVCPEKDLEHSQLSTTEFDDKLVFPALNITCPSSQKTIVSGKKRGFSAAMIEFSERKYAFNSEVSPMPATEKTIDFSIKSVNREEKEPVLQLMSQEQTYVANNHAIAFNTSGDSPTKVQVIGWPPIVSFRKNTKLITKGEEEDVKKKKGLYIKVSMDGAPYLRKVDLRAYSDYQDLSTGLKNIFSCFTLGRYGSHGAAKEITKEGKLKIWLHGCEYVLTYEDKDGDLMLLGDVPWQMFLDTCKRLRIMKGLEVISLAPTAMEKCRNKS